jgi:hypothetical protein
LNLLCIYRISILLLENSVIDKYALRRDHGTGPWHPALLVFFLWRERCRL